MFFGFGFISIYAEDITIGTQVWMTRNLDVNHYRNGDSIRHAATVEDWIDAGNHGEGAWCYYNNDTAPGKIYGKLYNWYAVNDPRGLAPLGYHVPSDEEWAILENYLGGWEIAGGKLKEKDTIHWLNPNTGATNTTGFSALPGGYRNDSGIFQDIGSQGIWWSATEFDNADARYIYIANDYPCFGRLSNDKVLGFSVRCVKD